jgi:hypothetical protein
MLLTEKLLLFCLFLQTLELWRIRSACSDDGIWQAQDLKLQGLWMSRLILSSKSFEGFLILRMLMILAAGLSPTSSLFLFLFASQLLLQFRFRGPFNGGSDYLTTQALASIWIRHSFPESDLIQQMCLLYLGLQVCLSYFISGFTKAFSSSWRKGLALQEFLLAPKYLVPLAWQQRAREGSLLLRIGTYAVLCFELCFPFTLLHPSLCLVAMLIGACFHWMNFRVFGLNRFFWIWLACYPALYETSQWISQRL